MLAIRMQRTGRKGHAMFRVVVQESRLTPTSGKVVAFLGSYDPHNKKASIVKDKAEFYLKNGAQPSDRAARILEAEGVALPAWFTKAEEKKRATRNPEKLRKNQPKEEKPTAEAKEVVEEAAEEPAESEAKTEA
jgi:small subunit ribosomal protein S16